MALNCGLTANQLGRLNLLTKERVAAAAKLIITGEIINLKFVQESTNMKHQKD